MPCCPGCGNRVSGNSLCRAMPCRLSVRHIGCRHLVNKTRREFAFAVSLPERRLTPIGIAGPNVYNLVSLVRYEVCDDGVETKTAGKIEQEKDRAEAQCLAGPDGQSPV